MRNVLFSVGIVVALSLICCSSSAMAGLNVFHGYIPDGYAPNALDWTDSTFWLEVDAWGPPEVTHTPAGPPVWTSGIYLYNTGPDYPMTVYAEDAAHADYIYMGGGDSVEDLYGDRLDIYGTLDMVDGPMWYNGYNSIFFGHAGALNNPPPAVLTVHEGGYINCSSIWAFGGDATHIDYVVLDGGLLTAEYIWTNPYNICPSQIGVQLNGGILNLTSGIYDGQSFVAGSSSARLTVDIAGGTLIIGQSGFDACVAGGVILSNGTTVTDVTVSTLLYIDDVTYRNSGRVAVSLGSGGPGAPSTMYTNQWAMDDNAANTTVVDSIGGLDGTMSENTSAHHSADAMEGTGSLNFDGVNDYIALPRNSTLEQGNPLSNQITIAAWIKPDGAASQRTIMGTGNGGWTLGTTASGFVTFTCDVADPNGNPAYAGTVVVTDDTPVFDTQWHHVFAVVTGSSLALYVDDEPRATYDFGFPSDVAIQNTNDMGVVIGANAAAMTNYWDGLIDDVRIYNFALYSEDVYHFNYPEYEWNPSPPNGANWIDPNNPVTLEWSAGDNADSHDVYFGKQLRADIARDDEKYAVNIEDLQLLASGWLADQPGSNLALPYDTVDFADFAVLAEEWGQTSLIFQGNTTDPTYVIDTPLIPLDKGVIYYWRIDEIQNADPGNPRVGRVHGFITTD